MPGAATTSGGKKYVCVKTGSKFVWKKATGVTTKPITVDPVAACKLPVADGRGDVSIGGWPRIKERLKSTGDVIATVVMVDFSDAPATMTPAEAFARISPSADVFKEVSYGKFNYVFKPQLKWYRMSKKSSDYVTGGWTFNSHRAYISEAANLADLDVDFSKTDSLIILANPDARGIGNSGPAFAAIRSNGLTLDGRYISNGATSAYDLNNWKAIWLNHEVTHTLGLVDLYAFTQENSANQYDGLRYTGEFSYMGFSSYESNSPSLLAYERWNLGWLDDSQIKCMNESKTTQLITPVETIGGVKAVMVPISKTKAVVIESRRPLGIDSKLAKSGALVYVVDSTNQSGLGPVKVYPSDVTSDPRYLKAPRAVGEKITIEGVTVTVTQSNESGDTVEGSKG
jgi:M6 family metalloprotease-like protein